MDNPHVDLLSNLFNEIRLVTGPENPKIKYILVVVDNKLDNVDLKKITETFSNKATFKFTEVANVEKGMFIDHCSHTYKLLHNVS